ncbi:hypothetical protein BH10PSE6_BH10PSE6_33280 [soil metagenome]
MLLRIGALATFALTFIPSAFAQTSTYLMNEGGQTGKLTIVRQSDGSMAVEAGFGVPGRCLGNIKGRGSQKGSTIIVRAEPPCTLTIDVKGNTAVVREDNCGMWHGPSCMADGTYKLAK